MRKKLVTRFPAPRIKKIMQADEDIGKIASSVPLLVSKALELFLQDLCDRTYEVTRRRGAKTLNSLHLQQCVKMYGAFDFLTDVVNKVPNLGGTESFGDGKGISRRRKTIEYDGDTRTDESRFAKAAMTSTNSSPGGRWRARGRRRGRPPSNRNLERESSFMKYEEEIDLSPEHDGDHITDSEAKDNVTETLNPASQTKPETTEAKPVEHSAWPSPGEGLKLGIEPSNLINLNFHTDEDDDYDDEY